MKKINSKTIILSSLSLIASFVISCSDNWLDPTPLSFLSTSNAFTTVDGLKSGLNTCRKGLVKDFMLSGGFLQIDYVGTDLAVAVNGGIHNYDTGMLPSTSSVSSQWDYAYSQIKNANTIVAYSEKIVGDDSSAKPIIGEAYFFRAYWYYRLINLYGDVPLVLEEVSTPKLDFVTSTRHRIIVQMISDLEYAVENLPAMAEPGAVPRGAAQHLLTKYYLQASRFQDAVNMATQLINDSQYALMQNRFGISKNDASLNVMWDLFNKANISLAENTEKIMVVQNQYNVNGNSGNSYRMREFVTCWFNTIYDSKGKRGTVDGITGEPQITNTGRGIGKSKKTNYYCYSLWTDKNDLRHAYPACWIPIDSLIYNNPTSVDYGKHIVKATCKDTLKGFDDMYINKTYVEDEALAKYNGENIMGGCTDWYVFRLAETYLLRAEAYTWLGQGSLAAADINVIRNRVKATPISGNATLNDVLDERARELYLEEFRKTELTRIAYIMASGNLNGYSLENMSTKNYYYDRVMEKNNYYHTNYVYNNVIYKISPFHIYWPIPEAAIEANSQAVINQNYGYVGYENNITPLD